MLIALDRYEHFRFSEFLYEWWSARVLILVPLAIVLWNWMNIMSSRVRIEYLQGLVGLKSEDVRNVAAANLIEHNLGSRCRKCILRQSRFDVDKHISEFAILNEDIFERGALSLLLAYRV